MVIPSPGNLLSKVEDALLAMILLTKLLHTSTALLLLFTYVTLTFDLKDSQISPLFWCCAQDIFWITSSSDRKDVLNSKIFCKRCRSFILVDYIACKRFAVLTLLWSLEFVIQNKSRARHRRSLTIHSKLTYLSEDGLILIVSRALLQMFSAIYNKF